jgi:hypothetical protein
MNAPSNQFEESTPVFVTNNENPDSIGQKHQSEEEKIHNDTQNIGQEQTQIIWPY